ncbi:MAG: adenosylcobalamin-dependent ribonucleoside-diphosphate reductase, partial [Nanoarchaeota archaeon]
GTYDARTIFKLIAASAWKSADPGVVFLDTINKTQPTPKLGQIESTNPCGEVPLLPYEACNLGSVNLANFVTDGEIDYERLADVVHDAVHFLDNVIDMSRYPLPQIVTMVHGNRKIGLGVMGFADLLVKVGIPYDSKEGLALGERIMRFVDTEAKKASVALAKERGVFPNFKESIYDTGKKTDRVRNATRTSIAPTGTIAIITGCSSGIEPLFSLAYTHTILEKKQLIDVNTDLVRVAKQRGFYSSAFLCKLQETGDIKHIAGVPADLKRVFVTALEVSPDYHVRMQAVFQQHTDNAVSKTVNLPIDATVKDVERIYKMAYELGCKGISVYRYGSKANQILVTGAVCRTCGTDEA